jgi:sensor histidine kinase YesM
LLFWGAVIVFYTYYFGRESDSYWPSFVIVSLLLPVTAGTAILFTRFLIPRYLLARRYVRFAVYCVYALIGSLYLELLIVFLTFIFVADYQLRVLDPSTLDLVDLLVGMYLVVLFLVSWNLQQRWSAMRSRQERLERERLEAQLKLKEVQLKMLQAQVHPHFLFNTLNNLYSLTLERSERAADVVLRLSELLDYMLYKGDQDLVPLKEEIACIHNYIALEQLRFSERIEIRFECTGSTEGVLIAPLILLPLVENCFKHGVRPSVGSAWVFLTLTVSGTELILLAQNSVSDGRSAPGAEGIGLPNLRKRLELLYPDRHRLILDANRDTFRVELGLNLDRRS